MAQNVRAVFVYYWAIVSVGGLFGWKGCRLLVQMKVFYTYFFYMKILFFRCFK